MTKKTRQPKPTIKPETMWALWNEDVGVCYVALRPTRRYIQTEWSEAQGMPWSAARTAGFRAVKVRVEPVE